MKKSILLLVIAIMTVQSAYAVDVSNYFDQGGIFTKTNYPVDVAKNKNNMPALENLKTGTASTHNILGLVELGNRGIQAAAKNGGIKKISHIDIQEKTVFIFWRGVKVTVYGE